MPTVSMASVGMRSLLCLSCLLLASSCQESAIGAVKKMQSMACEGNSSGFLSRIDKNAFTDAMVAHAEKNARSVVEKDNSAVNQQAFQEYLKTGPQQIRTVATETFSEWEANIKQAKDSDFCRMSVIDSDELKDDAHVRVRTPSGKNKLWRLLRRDKEWRLVEMFGAETTVPPLGSPLSVSPEPPVVDRASVDAVLERVAHAKGLFTSNSGTTPEAMMGRYEMAVSDLRIASQQLFPRPPNGVPDAVARTVSSKLDVVISAFEATMKCLRGSQRASACDEVSREVRRSSNELGQAVVGLAAYGSKPLAEATKAFE